MCFFREFREIRVNREFREDKEGDRPTQKR